MPPFIESLEDIFNCDGSRMFLCGSVCEEDFISKLEETFSCDDWLKKLNFFELQQIESVLSSAMSRVREQLERDG
jgi:hypothetical protein